MKCFLSTLFLSIALCVSADEYLVSKEWGLAPLGTDLVDTKSLADTARVELKSRHQKFPTEGEGLTLFKDGEANCLIVLPEVPSGSEKMAAALFNSVLEKISGKPLPIESEHRIEISGTDVLDAKKKSWPHAIWIGNTKQAEEQGIRVDDLVWEGYRLKTVNGWLFAMGHDKPRAKVYGNAYAVVGILEDYLGVRWLWPGELGTVIPKSRDLSLPAIHEQNEPALRRRGIRSRIGISDRDELGLKVLGNTEQNRLAYTTSQTEQSEWARMSRIGGSYTPSAGHSYSGWYEKYGKEHPDWFALQPNGSREQRSDRPRLCKSNPEVASQKAKEVIEQYQKNPDLDAASISPNDGSGLDSFCMCAECRKLDPPEGHSISLLFWQDGKRAYQDYVSLSDRLAVFYNRIAEEVTKTVPQANLGAYAYSAYRDVPVHTTLHPSIIVGFVGLNYFDENLRQEDIQRWDGWSHRASQLFLRPNITGPGNLLPAVFVTRLAEDIRHMYETGMVATDFDSLTGSWSTVGINYYVLAKLLWDPSVDVEAVMKDYCEKGFGSAADHILAYFHELDHAVDQVAAKKMARQKGELRKEEEDTTSSRKREEAEAFSEAYFGVFTAEYVAQLNKILNEASNASEDERVKARIAFLSKGLEYANRMRATVEAKDAESSKQAFRELLSWYRTNHIENPHAIGIVPRLFRTGASFRGLDK